MIPIVLKVYDGGKLKHSRAFSAERIRLGSASADLVLDSSSVSPSHAIIETGAAGAVLRALSTAPLYLNGQPIIAAPLRHGDLISIGELRIMVEIQKSAPQLQPQPQKIRPRLQLIHNEGDGPRDVIQKAPSLSVVREEDAPELASNGDQELYEEVAPPEQEEASPESPPPPELAAVPAQIASGPQESAALALPVEAPAPQPRTELPAAEVQGGECAEVELFWGSTRVSVWQLLPGERLTAGSESGCDALLHGIGRAAVLRSDANGWTVSAPRPLQLFLEEDGRVLGGPELLVRGRSQADAQGLVVPLPQRAVAVLRSENLALRIRRVRGVARVGGEQNDWKGVLVAAVAAVLMMLGMKIWTATVPPQRTTGEAVLIRPRPLIVRAATPKPNNAPPIEEHKAQAQGRDPGKAVARHLGQEGEAGSRTAPRRNTRAQRTTDDKALVAQTGLLKALGGGKGENLFGVALEKGTVDAMGHLTGPRVADARGEGGMGLKSLGGRGGGGDGSGLGLARIGTNGIGGGLASYGDGKGGLRGKENGEIGLGPEKPLVQGSIDPELIRKVVHDHRAQIRTCYETQLTSKPNLAGKLVSAWTIDQSGAVTEAHTQESTLHDHAVENCVAQKIRTWRFPIPKGGGEVFVTYPFIFTPGG
jgi:pSer/pThr/pTyr-binding forkhead associated (FHA) protein